MKAILKVMTGMLLAMLVVVVGCAALASESIKQVERDDQKGAITRAQAESAKLGTTRAAVERKLGKPKDTQESDSTYSSTGDGIADVYAYYPVKGGELLDRWQFAYDGRGQKAKLISRNRY